MLTYVFNSRTATAGNTMSRQSESAGQGWYAKHETHRKHADRAHFDQREFVPSRRSRTASCTRSTDRARLFGSFREWSSRSEWPRDARAFRLGRSSHARRSRQSKSDEPIHVRYILFYQHVFLCPRKPVYLHAETFFFKYETCFMYSWFCRFSVSNFVKSSVALLRDIRRCSSKKSSSFVITISTFHSK